MEKLFSGQSPNHQDPSSQKMCSCFSVMEDMKASMCVVELFLSLLLKQITFNMESNVQTLLFKGIYYFKCVKESLSPILPLQLNCI